jgi:hypothetical protein
MKVLGILFICLVMLPGLALAIVFGGTNLGFGGYPEFRGFAPSPPIDDDEFSYQMFQQQMQQYRSRNLYRKCAKRYGTHSR